MGRLPRVMASREVEGHERRNFYGTVWAMCIAQRSWVCTDAAQNQAMDALKLVVFIAPGVWGTELPGVFCPVPERLWPVRDRGSGLDWVQWKTLENRTHSSFALSFRAVRAWRPTYPANGTSRCHAAGRDGASLT